MRAQPLCPKCQLPLRRYTVGTVTADGCLQCGGVALAPTTLYTLAQAPHLAFALEDAFADQTPIPLLASEMPCPLCGALMERAFLAVAPSMEIERCPQCGLIWLDDGELAKLGQTLQRSVPSAPTDEQAGETPATAPPTWVYCAHCGRENFSDATECWACGEPLVPEQPPLPGFAQRMAEWVAMALGGTGAILFGTFVARPQGDRWAALGLMLMLCGLGGLALLRRVWRRPRGSGVFPGYSE